MEIQVLYFAFLREEKGCSSEIVVVQKGCTPEMIFEQLFDRSSVGIRFAVNEIFVDAQVELTDGDVLAFLPPMGGG